MHRSTVAARLSVSAVCWLGFAVAHVSADDARVSQVAVPYQDDFSYAAGGRQTQTDGQDPVSEGEIHCSMYTYGRPHRQAPGMLKLIMTEDDSVQGPDGRAGVLRMEFADVPVATLYAGFAITGNKRDGGITFPNWTGGDVSTADLDQTFVSFRFRAENRRDPQDFAVPLNFRFEPDEEGSLEFAADFGTLFATRTWRTLKRPIGSARNVDLFLENVNRKQVNRFKLVWNQAGPIDLYQPGDSLLIDDLKITIE
ncbi:MAG: hypothetical protein AB7I48_14480 [Planctomycetaceae bacterium]